MTLILDGHIHLVGNDPPAEAFLAELRAAGVGGAALISTPPASFERSAPPAAARLQHVLDWCVADPELYSLFWIDPTEPDALDQVAAAVAKGIAGFKVICDHFPPGHPAALPVYRAIVAAGRPILFHSGILWDGKPSSDYSRPAGFEALLDVPGLRFALAHIGWPWCDELIAVYGKFLNARASRASGAVEMYIDTTPGTPPIYRQRALTDLFGTGYAVADNVIFGSDCCAPGYNVQRAQQWLQRDEEILTALGVGADVLGKVRGGNLRRFLGLPAE
jgi:predicted TIM-barrel fold metal-dependent hydrolase